MKKFEVCNNVAELRVKKGYTQIEFSEITKLSQQYISRVENGKLLPSIGNAITIAEALDKYFDEVFFKC